MTEEGYITNIASTPVYHYYLKDHQGNNRVVIDQSGAVKQVNHYYPFGGLFGDTVQLSNQPYKYNGKELDRMHGLDLFDYGARHYDAAIGRWGTVDPLAEKYYSVSPYVYVENNPIKYVDINGREKLIYYLIPSIDGLIASKYPDDKNIHIFAHSTNEYLFLDNFHGVTGIVKNAKGLKYLLDRDSETWTKRNEGENLTIILHGCNIADNGNGKSLVEILSESSEFKGMTIVAPDNKHMQGQNKDGLFKYIGVYGRKDGTDLPDRNNMGSWLVYKNGKKINPIPGDKMPTERNINNNKNENNNGQTWDELMNTLRLWMSQNPNIIWK